MANQEIVYFKSVPKNFDKEKSGIKNNTFRKVDTSDDRFEILLNYIGSNNIEDFPLIKITNPVSGEDFTREIRDITFWDGWLIITWQP